MNEIENRVFQCAELRIERSEKDAKLVGHAAVFNTLSVDLGGFRERIDPGAFTRSITEDDIRALFNHDANHVLGRNRSGTLRLAEDNVGLAVEIDLPDTQLARDLAVSIERGDVSQMSFAFRVHPGGQEWRETDDGIVRTLKAVRLYDVSPVTYPAYPNTDVALRSFVQWKSDRTNADRSIDPINLENLSRRRRLRLRELMARGLER